MQCGGLLCYSNKIFYCQCHYNSMRINFVGINLFYFMQINHRKILDGLFAACGVPPEKFKPICSAVDKLDKVSLDTISGIIFVPESMIINLLCQSKNCKLTNEHLSHRLYTMYMYNIEGCIKWYNRHLLSI